LIIKVIRKIAMNKFKKKIYIAGKFQNSNENKNYIEEWCLKLSKWFPDYLFLNGVSTFSYYYNVTDMKLGLKMCIELLKTCDAIVTVGDYANSIGTWVELMIAEELGLHSFEHIDAEIENNQYFESQLMSFRGTVEHRFFGD
jgi:hypothetical protein